MIWPRPKDKTVTMRVSNSWPQKNDHGQWSGDSKAPLWDPWPRHACRVLTLPTHSAHVAPLTQAGLPSAAAPIQTIHTAP